LRPRISQKEAKFISELLEVAIKDLELKKQYQKELDLEVFRLKRQLIDGAGYDVIMAGYPEKKKELHKWQFYLGYLAYNNLTLTERLLEKYKAIANGEKHRGTYKHLNCGVERFICSKDEGKLTEILSKQLEPIEDLGKRQTIAEQRAIQ